MHVEREHVHRPIARDGVEPFPPRRNIAERLHAPAVPAEHRILGVLLDPRSHLLEDRFLPFEPTDVHAELGGPEAGEVIVGIDEPRQQHATGEIDLAGVFALPRLRPRPITDIHDRVAANGNGLRVRPRRIDRVNEAAAEEPVGRAGRGIRLGGLDGCTAHREAKEKSRGDHGGPHDSPPRSAVRFVAGMRGHVNSSVRKAIVFATGVPGR